MGRLVISGCHRVTNKQVIGTLARCNELVATTCYLYAAESILCDTFPCDLSACWDAIPLGDNAKPQRPNVQPL